METPADADFIRGMRFIFAARRCDAWAGDRKTKDTFGRMAVMHRRRAMTLMQPSAGELDEGAPQALDAPSVRLDEGSFRQPDTSDPREGGGSLDWIW